MEKRQFTAEAILWEHSTNKDGLHPVKIKVTYDRKTKYYPVSVEGKKAYSTGGPNMDVHVTDPRGISPDYGLVEAHWRNYSTSDIRNSLAQGSPVIIAGNTDLKCVVYCWGVGDAHEWVIDGMRDLGVKTTYQLTTYYLPEGCEPTTVTTYTSTLILSTQIHQNWGWGPGKGSGPNDWYALNVFQSIYPGSENFNRANYIVAFIRNL